MKTAGIILIVLILFCFNSTNAQVLQVKEGKNAILKEEANGNAKHIRRLSEGTKVTMLGEVSRYYSVQTADSITGYSYKGNFKVLPYPDPVTIVITKESLLAKTDVLKIVVIDVEVGDATLIICPQENGEQDIILIDTGEKGDGDRIKDELRKIGLSLSGQSIKRIYISHYDGDHMGDIGSVAHLAEEIYDLGTNDMPRKYKTATTNIDRREITLDYQEIFSGGVTIECVAANNATDFDPDLVPDKDKNTNSIALIITYNDFDYFTAGDLTFNPEKSLAKGVRNCDVYHANHHGSRTTSSHIDFVTMLDPEITIASNGHKHGHPSDDVAQRLLNNGSMFYQTNKNMDSREHQPADKYLGDNTFFNRKSDEEEEGAMGSIRIIVDTENYYVIMPRLQLSEGTFEIER